MDIMKDELLKQESIQLKATDDSCIENSMNFGGTVGLERRMAVERQNQKVPVNENDYLSIEFAETIQSIIDKNYIDKTNKEEIDKQTTLVTKCQKRIDDCNEKIEIYKEKTRTAQNKADRGAADEVVQGYKKVKSILEGNLNKEKRALEMLNEQYMPRWRDEATLEYCKGLPKILDALLEKKDTILNSQNVTEKEQFLADVSKVRRFTTNLGNIQSPRSTVKQDARYYDFLAKIDEKMVSISTVAAKLASSLIKFDNLNKKHNDLLTKNEKQYDNSCVEIKLVDEKIKKKKSLINALYKKLGKQAKYKNVVITPEAEREAADTVKSVKKMKGAVSLENYIEGNVQQIEALQKYKDETNKEKNYLNSAKQTNTNILNSIDMAKNMFDWMSKIEANQQTVLQSNDLEVKYEFIINVMKMDRFLQKDFVNVDKLASDEKMLAVIFDYVDIHKRQLQDIARKVTVQIFHLQNPEFKEPKLDYEDLKCRLDARVDETALLDTMVKFLMYNPDELRIDFRIQEAYMKYQKISDKDVELTNKQILNFKVKLAVERTKSILEYERLYKKIYDKMNELPKEEREEAAALIASLSEPALRANALNKVNVVTSMDWSERYGVYAMADEVNRWYASNNIEVGDIDKINDKLANLRTYESRLWDDYKYNSSSMEEMYFKMGQKAIDEAFFDKTNLLKKNLKQKVLSRQESLLDKEKNEKRKKELAARLAVTEKFFGLGELIETKKVVEELVKQKKEEYLSEAKKKLKNYGAMLKKLEAYKGALDILCDDVIKRSVEYTKTIQALEWQLDSLSMKTKLSNSR